VAPESQHIGAIGAALFAWERAAHGAVSQRNNQRGVSAPRREGN